MNFSGHRNAIRRAPLLLLLAILTAPLSARGHDSHLDYIYDKCLDSFEAELGRDPLHLWFVPSYPPPTQVTIRNPNRYAVSICIYDIVCQRMIRTVRLSGRSETSAKICVDDDTLGRGSILVLYKNGNVLRYDNLRSDRATLPERR